MNTRYEYLLKFCLIGSNPGFRIKLMETMIQSKITRESIDTHRTLGVFIQGTSIMVKDIQVKLILVDTLSHEFFGKLRPSYYRGASGAAITYNKFDRKSFDAVPDWLKEFRNNSVENLPVVLVGFKDKPKSKYIKEPVPRVTKKEGQALADELNLPYFECHPSKREDLVPIFQHLSRKVIEVKD